MKTLFKIKSFLRKIPLAFFALLFLAFITPSSAFALDFSSLDERLDELRDYAEYPSRLGYDSEKESAIAVSTNGHEAVLIYDGTSLSQIHFPDINVSILIDISSKDESFIASDDVGGYEIIFNSFDDYDLSYQGGSGISDMITENYVYNEMEDQMEVSVYRLTVYIEKYLELYGEITPEEVSPSNEKLMAIDGMNSKYFFDGEGDMLVFTLDEEDDWFTVESINQYKYEGQSVSSANTDRGTLIKVALGIGLFVLACVAGIIGLIVGLFYLFRRKQK